jgi:hypothetical protein
LILENKREKESNMKYTYLALIFVIFALSACKEPRRTPDGHLMDKPTPSAYAPKDFNTPGEQPSDEE